MGQVSGGTAVAYCPLVLCDWTAVNVHVIWINRFEYVGERGRRGYGRESSLSTKSITAVSAVHSVEIWHFYLASLSAGMTTEPSSFSIKSSDRYFAHCG